MEGVYLGRDGLLELYNTRDEMTRLGKKTFDEFAAALFRHGIVPVIICDPMEIFTKKTDQEECEDWEQDLRGRGLAD